MVRHMMVNGIKEKYKVAEFIDIAMDEYIKENGDKIWCMEMAFINGKMAENMLVDINMIKKVDMENITGMMDVFLKGCGKMVKETDRVEFSIQMVMLKLAFGKTIKE